MAPNKKTSGAAQSNRRQHASGEDRNARMPLPGFVPVPIEAGWVPGYDHLEGFPVTVLFAAVSRVGDALTPRCCTYIPEPGTYIESSGRRDVVRPAAREPVQRLRYRGQSDRGRQCPRRAKQLKRNMGRE